MSEKIMNYLTRRQNGIYYFRMAVPRAVRAGYGRNEICFSLKTTDRKTAQIQVARYVEQYLVEFSQKTVRPHTAARKKFYTLKDVYERYAKERKLSDRMKRDFDTVIERFIKFLGNKDIRLYGKSDIINYKDMLISYPAHIAMEDLNLDIQKILKKYKSAPKLSNKTINGKHIAYLKTVFNYAKNNGFIPENPCLSVSVIGSPVKEPKRLPYTFEQIQTLLQTELFTKPQNQKFTEYRFVILMAIFQGMRLEEICRARNSDIGEADGVPYVCIQEHPEDGHTLKTAGSRRRIPLHPGLMNDFGFSDYLTGVRREKFVFPVMNVSGGYDGVVGFYFSKWFGRTMKTKLENHRQLSFHSFRHSFKVFGRTAGLEQGLLDYLQGHTTQSVSLNYGRDVWGSPYPLKTLYDAICKIDELNRLKPQK